MNIIAQAATSFSLVVGPFVDATDGVTPETGLTIAQADVRLSKNAGAFAQKNEATSATHMENGYYSVPMNATDTNTLGRLFLAITAAGALPVWREYIIVPDNTYAAMVAGTDWLEVDAHQIEGVDATDQLATALATYDAPTKAELDSGFAALNDLSAAQVNAEVVDALATDAYAELGAVPAANAALADKINWLFALARNKLTNSGTTLALRNDADSGDIASATVTEAAGTVTRGEFS